MTNPPVIRIRLVLVASLGAAVLLIGFVQPAGGTTRKEASLLSAVNQARAAHGLRTLRIGPRIQRRAHKWAVYLQRRNTFYHAGLARGVRENIGWLSCRRGWARSVVRMWLSSPGHRSALLDGSARRVGAGASTGSFSRFGCAHVTVTRFR